MTLSAVDRHLSDELAKLRFAEPVTHVYDPLAYAREPHEAYLCRYGALTGRVVLLGMNPGPYGMAQTGVPFGDPAVVRDVLGIRGTVGQPSRPHPKRPVLGLSSPRSEVSGTRLWGWAVSRFGSAESFLRRFFVLNYCPLCFMEETGRNRTPDKLPAAEREPLFALCDEALRGAVALLRPRAVVGVGAFAAARAAEALAGTGVRVGTVLHPSPASPAANRGWAEAAEKQLRALGVELP